MTSPPTLPPPATRPKGWKRIRAALVAIGAAAAVVVPAAWASPEVRDFLAHNPDVATYLLPAGAVVGVIARAWRERRKNGAPK